MYSTCTRPSLHHTTSQPTMSQRHSNGWWLKKYPVTNLSAGAAAPLPCSMRHTGKTCPDLPGNAEWISNTQAHHTTIVVRSARSTRRHQSSLSPSNARRSRSSGIRSQQGRTLSIARIRLRLSRPLAPPFPLHAIPRRRLLLVQGPRQTKITRTTTFANLYIVRFLDEPRPIQLTLSPARYDANQGAPCRA